MDHCLNDLFTDVDSTVSSVSRCLSSSAVMSFTVNVFPVSANLFAMRMKSLTCSIMSEGMSMYTSSALSVSAPLMYFCWFSSTSRSAESLDANFLSFAVSSPPRSCCLDVKSIVVRKSPTVFLSTSGTCSFALLLSIQSVSCAAVAVTLSLYFFMPAFSLRRCWAFCIICW